jgi:hypothetical protein
MQQSGAIYYESKIANALTKGPNFLVVNRGLIQIVLIDTTGDASTDGVDPSVNSNKCNF